MCFNSTLVRFKRNLTSVNLPVQTTFQFHIGSIQARYVDCVTADSKRLVSIPHWFDSSSGRQRELGYVCRFQFHIGSIQAGRRLNATKPSKQVSIPHWFDSSSNYERNPSVQRHVSIPHWFDSSLCRLSSAFVCDVGFNSTLVRFKRSTLAACGLIRAMFQFHIGSIQATRQLARAATA